MPDVDPSLLLLGGVVATLVAILAGASGFGFGIVATPLFLLLGFSLPFVVTANLLASLVTRVSVAYRLRAHVRRRQAMLLVAGSVPGSTSAPRPSPPSASARSRPPPARSSC